MVRIASHAITAGAAILVALAAGCAPPPPPVVVVPVHVEQPTRTACGNGSGMDFVRLKVRLLKQGGFDFQRNGYDQPGKRLGYHRPTFEALPADRAKAFAQAYDSVGAPEKAELCKSVDWVFLDENKANAGESVDSAGWAFWEVTADDVNTHLIAGPKFGTDSSQADGTGRYIGVVAPNVDRFGTLAALENDVLASLLAGTTYTGSDIPKITVSKDGFAVLLAGVMLHELGHLRWYEECYRTTTACKKWVGERWTQDLNWPVAAGIHAFDTNLGARRTSASADGIEDIRHDNGKHLLKELYGLAGIQKRLWASLMAGIAPDEDYAEALKFTSLHACGIKIGASLGRRTSDSSDFLRTIAATSDSLPPTLAETVRLRPRFDSGC